MEPVTEQDLRTRLDEIRATDPTGGLKIVDCPHGWGGIMIVRSGEHHHMCVWADHQCSTCDSRGCRVQSWRVVNCPLCGRALSDAPTRNYVLGQNLPLDEHLLRFGAIEA